MNQTQTNPVLPQEWDSHFWLSCTSQPGIGDRKNHSQELSAFLLDKTLPLAYHLSRTISRLELFMSPAHHSSLDVLI